MLQYTYLLTSQLEAQRLYFEEKMERIEAEAMKQVVLCVHCVSISGGNMFHVNTETCLRWTRQVTQNVFPLVNPFTATAPSAVVT